MDKLTPLETALLREFESLAAAFETSLQASKTQEQRLSALSGHCLTGIKALNNRQNALETRLNEVTEALNKQTASTNALIDSVNRLLTVQSTLKG